MLHKAAALRRHLNHRCCRRPLISPSADLTTSCSGGGPGENANSPSFSAKRTLTEGMDKTNTPRHALAEMSKTPRSTPAAIRVIEVLTYPQVQLLDVAGPLQVFASANDLVTEAGGTPP